MPQRQIRELRKNGDIDRALELAQEHLDEAINSIWLKREIGWVYYAKAKHAAETNDVDVAAEMLGKIADLGFDCSDESILAQSIPWVYSTIAKSLVETYGNDRDFEQNVRHLVNLLKQLVEVANRVPMERPSKGYSSFMSHVHRLFKDRHGYATVFHEIGFQSFSAEDYAPYQSQSGRSVLPLVEKIFLAYTKALLEGIARNNEVAKQYAEQFLEVLNGVKQNHHNFIWTDFNITKLLRALNRTNEAIASCRDFIQRKPKEFWAWVCLGQIYEESNVELALSCYCVALSCRADEEFMVSAMEDAARTMAKAGYYNEARTEIERAVRVRMEKWGRIPDSLESMKHHDWYNNATVQQNNTQFYKEHSEAAKNEIFGVKKSVIITHLNRQRFFANYISEEGNVGFFSYRKFQRNRFVLAENKIYYVTFIKEATNGPSDVFSIGESRNQEHDNLCKRVCGPIRIISSGVGFVEDCFVPPALIQRCSLQSGQRVSVVAVRSFDRRKSALSWTAIDAHLQET